MDLVFRIDQYQANPKNERVMCPRDEAHGPMMSKAGGQVMMCNDRHCLIEIGVPAELIHALPK